MIVQDLVDGICYTLAMWQRERERQDKKPTHTTYKQMGLEAEGK